MPKKNSHITVTDQFCGAGGSSQGARRLANRMNGGLEVSLALNHWKLAIETHNTNFPDTIHDCTDISACDPRRYPSTDILITSPECTTHSPAGGNNHKALKKQMDLFDTGKIDPATERSRATMWDVCRFAEYHNYNIIIAENVVEAKTRWALFDTWLSAMSVLGYNHRCIYINSMHAHPTPQSRDRMYVVFWKKGNKAPLLDYTPKSYCIKCQKDIEAIQTWKDKRKNYGKYNKQYVYCCPTCSTIVEPYYYAAFNCIDWSDIGTKISERAKPLAENTINRIKYGLKKFSKDPFIVNAGYGKEARGTERHILNSLFTQTTSPGQAIIQQPFIIDDKQSTGISFRTRSITGTVNTITTDHRVKLITPPFLINSENSSSKPEHKVRSSTQSLNTQTTAQSNAVLIPPFITEMHSKGNARPITGALNTVTSKGIKSGILTPESWNSFISYYYGGSQMASGINEAVGAITTKERNPLITYQNPQIEDCYYRMLKPNEIKLAMAFDNDYVILGNGRDQVKQCGNAVTPPVPEWILDRCIQSLS